MSASTLPPELWFNIFDFATFVPHCFDEDVSDPFKRPRRLGVGDATFMIDLRGDLREIRKALRTKRMISRICKAWHYLVVPLLYEALSLVRESNVLALAQQLEPTNIVVNGGPRSASPGLGRYTRRLDICPSICISFMLEPALLQLICQLPRLEIFVLRVDSNDGDYHYTTLRLIEALAATCIGTLRKLIWTISTGSKSVPATSRRIEHVYNLVDNAPKLKTVMLPPIFVVKARKHLIFAEVQTRTDRSFSSPVADSQGDVDLIEGRPGYAYAPLSYGHPTLAGDTAYVLYPMRFRSEYIQRLPDIRKVVLYCRHSEELVDYSFADHHIGLPKGVTHIGLHFGFTHRALRKFLGDITGMGYSPQVVRLLDEKIVSDLTRKHRAELRRMVEEESPFSFWRTPTKDRG
ncbi:hypothetical protein PENSPDRAFT_685228 [Peniophora sp. CONT]|nr:hypothetical protein PENSPDRAFT_685228 [Peniophora sp. CONT]